MLERKKISEQRREIRVHFERKEQNGKFHTTAKLVLAKRTDSPKAGLLHSAVYMARNSFEGDIPSVTRKINSFKPTTVKGKVFKAAAKTTNFVVHDVGRTALDVGLASETLALNTVGLTGKALKKGGRILYDKYQRTSTDDVNRAAIASSKLVLDARKGLKKHLKEKRECKLEKREYKLQKSELRNFKEKEFKPKLKKSKAELNAKKGKFKAVKKNYTQAKKRLKGDNQTLNLRKALYKKRRAKFNKSKKQIKLEIKLFTDKSKKLLGSTLTASLKYKYSKPKSILRKSSEYGAKSLASSAHQKLLLADERNDMVKIADKVGTAGATLAIKKLKKLTPKSRFQARQKKIRKLEKKSSKLDRKTRKLDIREKTSGSKSSVKNSVNRYRQKRIAKKNKKINKKLTRLKMARGPAAIFASFGTSTMILLLVAMLILTIVNGALSAIFGNSGWVMGTYTAQDKYLSQAEEYYTKLAWEMNKKVLKVGTSDWKDGLNDFNVSTSKMEDDVDTWIWGRSSYFDYDPNYDFDCFKLWSFLCAYYYDFSADESYSDTEEDYKSKAAYWKYGSDTETVIEQLFNAEYKFEYKYDNTSHWVEISPYNIFGGGSGSNGADAAYYEIDYGDYEPVRVTGNDNYTYKIHPKSLPSSIWQYCDSDGWLYFKKYNNEYRIVNCNETSAITGNWKLTPYIIPDVRYYVDSAHTVEPFYKQKNDGTFVFNPTGRYEYKRASRYWTNSDGTADEAWFAITPENAYCWNGTMGYWLCYYCQKYEWKTDVRLYYNVKQKKTFDEVIKSKLTSMDNGTERYNTYLAFLGEADDSVVTRGNHQEFACPLSGSIQDYISGGSIYNGYGYDMQNWNTVHCDVADDDNPHLGVDIVCAYNSKIYAGVSGTIDKIDTDNCIIIRKNSYNYWYDGDGNGKTRDTKIYYYNVSAKSSLKKGDTVKKGDYIGLSLPEKKCEDISNASTSDYHIHVKVEIDADGPGWHFIDPRLVFE
jgi:hypothetical protein